MQFTDMMHAREQVMSILKRWDRVVKSLPGPVRLMIAAPECLLGLILIATLPISAFFGIKIAAYSDGTSGTGLLALLFVVAQFGLGLFLTHRGISVGRGHREETDDDA